MTGKVDCLTPSPNILLVEDNVGDQKLTCEALGELIGGVKPFVVDDGEQALAFLRNKGKYADCPRPDLILLDLNIPKIDGRAVLKEVKSDPELRTIPVVVLTTSSSIDDIRDSYQLHANSYFTKPVDLDSFLELISLIKQYWLGSVALPNRTSNTNRP